MPTTTKPILAETFARALEAAGVLDNFDTTKRVVIDANAGDVVMVYVERYGDERLLQVALTLDGVEIQGVPA